MKIRKATARYEAWLSGHISLLREDLDQKHEKMREGRFSFLRATYYRWAQTFAEICPKLQTAARVLAVGDLHVENFGTWRDAEGRLAWGVNDFDEAAPLAYTQDLVRLAASAHLAIEEHNLRVDPREAAAAIQAGYVEALETGGQEFVLAEAHPALYEIALYRLRRPAEYWQKLDKLPTVEAPVPDSATRVLRSMFPDARLSCRIVHRRAGLGSLGRERFAAIADHQGGKIAREVKALSPPATVWAGNGKGSGKIRYQQLLDRAIRCRDPFVRLKGRWVVRRLAPDCSRLELESLPEERDEIRLLRAMGFETANVHLGSAKAKTILKDLKNRKDGWLRRAAQDMLDRVVEDWEDWRKN